MENDNKKLITTIKKQKIYIVAAAVVISLLILISLDKFIQYSLKSKASNNTDAERDSSQAAFDFDINYADIETDTVSMSNLNKRVLYNSAPVITDIELLVVRNSQQINITNKKNITLINGDKLIFKFNVADNESGMADIPNVKLQYSDNKKINPNEVSVSQNTYTYKFNIDCDYNIYITQLITDIKDNMGNIAESIIYSVNIKYNAAPIFIFESVTNPIFVKDESKVTYKFRIQDEDNVNITNIKINGIDAFDKNNLSYNKINGSVYDCEFTYQIPKGCYSHGDYIGITAITYNDKITADMPYNEKTISINSAEWNVIYYEPIKKEDVKVSVNSVNGCNLNDNTVTICNGGILKFIFANTTKDHPISINLKNISYKIDDVTKVVDIPKDIDKDSLPLIVSHTIPKDAYYRDLSRLSCDVSYIVTDAAGNELTVTETVSDNIIYYAPINADSVKCDLQKDTDKSANNNTDYARNDDVLNLICSMPNEQHKLTVSDFVITNLKCQVTINDKTTAKIDGADAKADEFFIKYKAVVTDEAGQKFETQELFSDIIYFAPITVDNINFISDNSFNNYAKLGSDLIFTAQTNRDVDVSVVTISDGTNSSVASSNTYANGKLRFTFNGINGFTNGNNILPEFTLTDIAGNIWISADNEISPIRYDSERPKVSITPKFDGFFSDDFSCAAVFNDSNLYVDGMSFTYVDEDTDITHSALNKDSFKEGETSFRQSLTLSNEGTFRVSAAVKDKASNSYSNSGMVVTIDKTNPEITSIKISADSVQIFKKGFAVKDYIDISEKYVSEIICKLSDSSGTADWDINTPIDTEGKKTISITAIDMAGNTFSYVFEVYIDATEPVPIVKDTLSDKELTSSDENTIIKEGKLYIALEEQQINEIPDEITSLKLLDVNGNLAYDFISEDGVLNYYEYELTEYGEYSLVLEAKDSAISADGDDGNTIGPITYKINFTKGTIWDAVSESPSLYYTAISIVGIAVIVGIVFFSYIFRKKKKDAESID